MTFDWNRPLTKAEMEAMRRAAGIDPRASRYEHKVRQGFWPRFRRIAGRVPFAEDVLAAFLCATDSRTPFRVRATLFAALVYFLWPSNIVPRLAIAAGLFDEAAVLLVTLRTLGTSITPEHRAQARRMLQREP